MSKEGLLRNMKLCVPCTPEQKKYISCNCLLLKNLVIVHLFTLCRAKIYRIKMVEKLECRLKQLDTAGFIFHLG